MPCVLYIHTKGGPGGTGDPTAQSGSKAGPWQSSGGRAIKPLEGLLLESESSPWATHKHLAAVSLSSSTRVKGDKGDTSKLKAGLFSKQGRFEAVRIAHSNNAVSLFFCKYGVGWDDKVNFWVSGSSSLPLTYGFTAEGRGEQVASPHTDTKGQVCVRHPFNRFH